YLLYDAGINARIAGDNALAISKLEEAWRKFDENKGYQKGGQSSTVISLVHYELAQAAEAQGDFSRARDSYARCLKVRPTYTQASVKLVHLLARKGQLELALATAKEACQASPKDPRGHLLVALMLDKLGRSTDAKQSDQEAESLLRVEGLVVPSATSQEKPVNKETVGKEAKKQLESDVMTDIDDDDSGAPLPGSDESED
ncbi:MAG: tetratricopeptide repeat protein, partial [Candidatus Obscuribacterales bacterium]|nr:tetratricopeptide repeat protein [Candidatus Obscuribacterales bacterium]